MKSIEFLEAGALCADGRPCWLNLCTGQGCVRRRMDSLNALKGEGPVYNENLDRFEAAPK